MTDNQGSQHNGESSTWEGRRRIMTKWLNKYYGVIFAVIGVALIAISYKFTLAPPDEALTAWTAWAAKYVALVVAAQKVWKISDVAIKGWAKHLGLKGYDG